MSEQKYYTNVKIKLRNCHDCGTKTSDYRCKKCQIKFREKHGVPHDIDNILDTEYYAIKLTSRNRQE